MGCNKETMSEMIGKYRIKEVLSKGGAATTYRARQPQLDRDVLLKVLHPSLTKDDKSVERFSREAKAVAKIRHAGIAHIYDYGKTNGLYYIAMEFVEGLSLAEVLAKEKRMPVDVATYVVSQASRGLGFVHSQGIVHRDIKPGNIILGYDGAVKVADFGLAYSEALPSITIDGELFGTPSYMSVEQIKGEEVDARADIYSLGLTFYQMLSGVRPFEGSNYSAIITKKLTEDVEPIKKIVPDCPQRLAGIVSKMVDRNPARRYQSMEDLSQELEVFSNESAFTLDERILVDYLGGKKESVLTIAPAKGRKRRGLYLYLTALAAVLIAGGIIGGRLKPESPVDTLNPLQPQVGIEAPSVHEETEETSAKGVEMVLPSVQVETGAILVTSVPGGADIFVDGTPQNSRTPALIAGLTPGEHEVVLLREGYGETGQKVSIEQADTSRVAFTLHPKERFGFVKINVTPWAVVHIDGDSIDTTPFNRLLRLDHGRHKLILANAQFPDYVTHINVTGGETTRISISLRDEFGYLMLKVHPWADVYIDGEYKDTTPLTKPIPLLPGKHLIKLIGPSSATWEKGVALERGETVMHKILFSPD
ncbi:PEGA domain-containing protein [candidate division TA06 bacterium]|uniref:PEGA domain-containing protein n=1 Tax=candidate division TA06 bacterium TaxID=2250710 RepID=A0A523UPI8_UNCT6|nr:MAG: PEGA domain-containing protein [candidate division TA06 bacterium]